MKPRTLRHELKYYLNKADYLIIKNRLSTIAGPDEHTDFNGSYRIRSLYFETPDDKALLEKLYGVNEREKFRIRYYNNDTSFIRLEKKTKINNLTNKISAPITKDECEKLIAGDTEWMRESKNALILEQYAKMKYELLRPKTLVDYMREPFVYPPPEMYSEGEMISVALRDPDMPAYQAAEMLSDLFSGYYAAKRDAPKAQFRVMPYQTAREWTVSGGYMCRV